MGSCNTVTNRVKVAAMATTGYIGLSLSTVVLEAEDLKLYREVAATL